MKHLLLIFIIIRSTCLYSQDEVNGITINPRITEKFQERKLNGIDKNSLSAVGLPFEDDFTNDHFIGNSEGNVVLWEDLSVYRNNGYAINPPSVGVATFDGLDETGYPYNSFAILGETGPADTLTSVEIDLSNTSGGLVLSFFYQPGGLGNVPEGQDSLVLEFYNATTDNWEWKWSTPGYTIIDQFDQFLISIDTPEYLVNNFQFRFRNYATLSGSWDHWNLDYVRLDQNRTLTDTVPIDICFGEQIYTLLNDGYTSIPWTHYVNSPSDKMASTKDITVRNLRSAAALINQTEVKVEYNGVEQINITDAQSPTIPPMGDLAITQEINSAPNNYFYDPNVNSISANFDVTFSLESSPNAISENDELKFTQRFQDYYDVSDGSAEISFGVADFTGFANIAYKVNALQADSLEAVQISFYPLGVNVEAGSFKISVWDDDGFAGSPGTLIYESADPETPEFTNTQNGYTVYPMDHRIFVDNSYYIGWKQSSTEKLTVGIDRSRDNNTDRFFYQVSGDWLPANVAGSTMMRPQYISDIPAVGVDEFTPTPNVVLWPNPANDFLTIQLDQSLTIDQVQIFDQLGKLISTQGINQNQIDTSFLPEGMYMVRLIGNKNNFSTTKKIVVTH